MKFYAQQGGQTIDFDIRAKADSVLDELAFVHLVKVKFNGSVKSLGRFWDVINGKKRRVYRIELAFTGFEPFGDAKYHCNRNLMQDGEIRSEYLGALDAADPGRLEARRLRIRIRKTEHSN